MQWSPVGSRVQLSAVSCVSRPVGIAIASLPSHSLNSHDSRISCVHVCVCVRVYMHRHLDCADAVSSAAFAMGRLCECVDKVGKGASVCCAPGPRWL